MNGQYDAVSNTHFNFKFKMESVVCLYQLLTLLSLSQSASISVCPKPIFCVESAHLPYFLHMQILNHLVNLVLHQRFKAAGLGRQVLGFFLVFSPLTYIQYLLSDDRLQLLSGLDHARNRKTETLKLMSSGWKLGSTEADDKCSRTWFPSNCYKSCFRETEGAQSGLCRMDLVHFRDDLCLCSVKASESIRNAPVSCLLV